MSYYNSPIYDVMQRYQTFKMNWDSYTSEERKILINSFRKELYEIKPTPLPETKPLELSPVQREKMLLEARKQINKELRQVRNKIKRNK